jgi:hypothetical protein
MFAYIYVFFFLLSAVVALLFTNQFDGLFENSPFFRHALFLTLALLLSGVYFVLRFGTRDWYETTGKIVSRKRFLVPGAGPLVEFKDKSGKTKRVQANRIAFYSKSPVKIRVSAKNNLHVVGIERLLIIPVIGLIICAIII